MQFVIVVGSQDEVLHRPLSRDETGVFLIDRHPTGATTLTKVKTSHAILALAVGDTCAHLVDRAPQGQAFLLAAGFKFAHPTNDEAKVQVALRVDRCFSDNYLG